MQKKIAFLLAGIAVAGLSLILLRNQRLEQGAISELSAKNERPSSLEVKEKNPLRPDESKPASACRREFGYAFYPKAILKEVLPRYQLKEDAINQIATKLANSENQIHDFVYQRAQEIDPNPLKNIDRKDDDKLYRNVVLEIFTEVLSTYGFNDPIQIETIFDDIQVIRTKKFAECEGYANKVKARRGFMTVVRTLTMDEFLLNVPEAFNPRMRKALFGKSNEESDTLTDR